ncbi:hypothetical protein KKA69_04910 [Patescibacteria group bacterium]|nr:hypothetical protein [Patescibacteria group bacterium]
MNEGIRRTIPDEIHEPVNPRRASTVILARSENGKPQVYLLKRSTKSRFMPDNYVFPGGTVSSGDCEDELWMSHIDLDLREMTHRFGGDLTESEVLAHGVAAIRETFEEAGVFLGSVDEGFHRDLQVFYENRLARALPKGWFREWVISGRRTLAFSSLIPWAHWITPKIRPQRYDTRFFFAVLPSGQTCIPDTRETPWGIWVSPEEGLAMNLKREIALSPPTMVTLHELSKYRDMGELQKDLETRTWGVARLPRTIPLTKGFLSLLPWDPMYQEDGEKIIQEMTAVDLLAPGEPLSRLRFEKGIWVPVKI